VLQKDRQTIQSMFAKIAHRYDRANHLLSFQIDHLWRSALVRSLENTSGPVLDVASGTGDLAVAIAGSNGSPRVFSSDFTFEMLAEGRSKLRSRAASARQLTADALNLPFRDASFEAVSVAFGIRNFADPAAGLREMTRVARPRGIVAVLEFSRPRGPFGALFQVYSSRVLPLLGGWITGHRAPYEYLPASVSEFPEGEAFLELMRRSGLLDVRARRMTGGIATLYTGRRP
jgi:demethylmenaquinone methyltransferase/2-methoxy-6-polyprenyl-1,4-benzoquinol methylase